MAIGIATNLNVNAGAPLDNKYGPYTGASEATAKAAADAATSGQRYKGLTVGLVVGSNALKEYWYQDGVTLVEKVTSGPPQGVTSLSENSSFLSVSASTGAVTISTNDIQAASNLQQDLTSTNIAHYPSVPAVKTYADTKSSKAFAIAMAAAL